MKWEHYGKKLYYRLLPTGLENKNDIVVIEQ